MAGDSKEVARAHLADAGVEELPDDWDVVTLGDLFTDDRGIAVGVMYPGDHDPDGVPLIKAGDLNQVYESNRLFPLFANRLLPP